MLYEDPSWYTETARPVRELVLALDAAVNAGAVTVSQPPAADAIALPGASGALTGAAGVLLGFSMRESGGVAAAVVRLRDGAVGGAILATVSLAVGESVRDWFGDRGVNVPTGIFFELVSGAVEGAVYAR